MYALMVKEFRELLRDRRTLAMLVALPVLLLVIFGYAANFSVDRLSVTVVGNGAASLSQQLKTLGPAASELDIVRIAPSLGSGSAQQILRDQDSDVVIAADGDGALRTMHVYLDGSALFTAKAAEGAFDQLAAQVRSPGAGASNDAAQGSSASPQITTLFNPDLKTSWVMVPGLIGLILLFIGALITSIGLVRERETGTLEQLAVMPLKPSAIIFGKVAPYFILALVDMAAVTGLGVGMFGVPFTGSFWLFSLSAIVFLFVVLGVGVLISSVSQSTGQAIQMAILFVVPQVLLSGLIFPLASMPIGVRWLGYILPLTWFRELSQGVMLRGAGIESLWLPVIILSVMAIAAFGASTLRMARSLSHGGVR